MTSFLYGNKPPGAPHLAGFSRDVGYHDARRESLPFVIPPARAVPGRDLQFSGPFLDMFRPQRTETDVRFF
jgi:hypothetical protein